jgi:hypothetical protein
MISSGSEFSSGGDLLTVRFGALEAVRSRFGEWSGAFQGAVGPVGAQFDEVVAGAGQFAGRVRPGAAWFLLSWKEVLGAFGQSAELIAANTGRTVVDLQATDQVLEVRL